MRISLLFLFFVLLFVECEGPKNELNSLQRENLFVKTNSEVFYPPFEILEDSLVIKYHFSFGECIGNCVADVLITSDSVLFISSGWGQDYFEETQFVFLIDSLEFQYLTLNLNIDDLMMLDPHLGCGDCLDGGEESLLIEIDGKSKFFFGTYGFRVPQIQSILDYCRGLSSRDDFTISRKINNVSSM